jgi:hypothetical protein
MVAGGAMTGAIFKAEQTATGFARHFVLPRGWLAGLTENRVFDPQVLPTLHSDARPPRRNGPSRGRLGPSWTHDLLEEEDLQVRQKDKADLV